MFHFSDFLFVCLFLLHVLSAPRFLVYAPHLVPRAVHAPSIPRSLKGACFPGRLWGPRRHCFQSDLELTRRQSMEGGRTRAGAESGQGLAPPVGSSGPGREGPSTPGPGSAAQTSQSISGGWGRWSCSHRPDEGSSRETGAGGRRQRGLPAWGLGPRRGRAVLTCSGSPAERHVETDRCFLTLCGTVFFYSKMGKASPHGLLTEFCFHGVLWPVVFSLPKCARTFQLGGAPRGCRAPGTC